jgi:hypothetical protein
MKQFDELKVTMHRDPVRSDRSARVAIERFLLSIFSSKDEPEREGNRSGAEPPFVMV